MQNFIEAKIGEICEIEAEIEGFPKPNVKWYYIFYNL